MICCVSNFDEGIPLWCVTHPPTHTHTQYSYMPQDWHTASPTRLSSHDGTMLKVFLHKPGPWSGKTTTANSPLGTSLHSDIITSNCSFRRYKAALHMIYIVHIYIWACVRTYIHTYSCFRVSSPVVHCTLWSLPHLMKVMWIQMAIKHVRLSSSSEYSTSKHPTGSDCIININGNDQMSIRPIAVLSLLMSILAPTHPMVCIISTFMNLYVHR